MNQDQPCFTEAMKYRLDLDGNHHRSWLAHIPTLVYTGRLDSLGAAIHRKPPSLFKALFPFMQHAKCNANVHKAMPIVLTNYTTQT